MADNYLNNTGLAYYHNRIKTLFPSKTEFDALDAKVDEIISEGGEPNVIESIDVNGTDIPPVNKNVSITVPTDLSDLTNTGQDPYATQGYVDQNGGKIDVIAVNNTDQTITNKRVNITVPTAVSDLTNDSGFQTANDVSGAITTALANGNDPYTTESDVDSAIDAALADITGIDFEVVQSLPQSGEKGTIYLVPNSGSGTNTYDEYIWVEPTGGTAHFEKIGTTDVDLSNYWTSTSGESNSLIAITTAQIDTIVAA